MSAPRKIVRKGLLCAAIYATAMLLGCTNRAIAQQGEKRAASQADVLYAAGIEDLKSGDLQGAKEKLEKVVKLVPGSAEAHNSFGFVLLTLGETEAAVRELRTAAKLKPEFVR